jgi:vacuolar-type H+-ATPase subunit F/Vma7
MRWVIIADELSALGWRLAGAQPFIATKESVQERFTEAQRDADLILITADLAKQLPAAMLEAALLSDKPLIAMIAALPNGSEPEDLALRATRVLGIAV